MNSIETRLTKLERIIPAVMPRPAGMAFDEFIALMVEALRGTPPADLSREAAPWLNAMTHDELRRLRAALAERLPVGAGLEATPNTAAAATHR